MPKVYGSYKTGADIYKDTKTKKFYIIEWSPTTQKTYKKFVAFKPDLELKSKTIKSSSRTNKKTRKHHKNIRRKQSGGQSSVPGQMPSSECKTQILNTKSYKSILDAQLNLADPQQVFKNIQTIRQKYSENFAGKRLVDVIYNHPPTGSGQVLGQFNMCWNHGVNNPESITGGAVGIHVYVVDEDGLWKLVGVFKRDKSYNPR
jgi:hypothetical protein